MFFKIIITLALLVSLSPVPSLKAEVMEFDFFTLDIPPNWNVNQTEGGVFIVVNDGSTIISILNGSLDENTDLATASQKLSKRINGDTPKDRGNGRAYSFSYSDPNTGHPAIALVTAVGKRFVYINQIGEDEEADRIIRSIKPKATSTPTN